MIFNREDAHYLDRVTQFLQRAVRESAKVLPVAISAEARRPPTAAGVVQSFDLPEQLRQRALSPSQVETIAKVFARQMLSILKPTLVSEPMRLFLSHRRLDGEDLTAAFTRLRTTSTDAVFRDLFDIRMGEDAQEVIDARLSESDAVIFLDTPKTGESPWIAKELRGALQFGLPIVWAKIGPEEGRVPLKVKPAETPHFTLPDIDPLTQEIPIELVEQIVHEAARIHHRDYVDRLFSEFLRLRDIANEHGIQLKQIDPQRMLYSLTLQRPKDRCKQRPLTHLLQLFGRTPTKLDISEFANCAAAGGYQAHPKHGHHYDCAILLAAIPPRLTAGPSEESSEAVTIIGKAAHISGASSETGSRRYVPSMTPRERMSIDNAIWLCSDHADLIDRDEVTYTIEVLQAMKRAHEALQSKDVCTGANHD